MRSSLDINHLILSKAGLVFNSKNGDSYQINKSANFIIELLQDNKTTDEIAKSLADQYSVTKKQALLDILEFESQLSIMGLV